LSPARPRRCTRLLRDPARGRASAPDDTVHLRRPRQQQRRRQPASPGRVSTTRPASPSAGAGATVALLDTGVSDTPALNRASNRLVERRRHNRSCSAAATPVRRGKFTDGYGHGTFHGEPDRRWPRRRCEEEPWGRRCAGGPPRRGEGCRRAGLHVALRSSRRPWTGSRYRHRTSRCSTLRCRMTVPVRRTGADPLTAAVEHVRGGWCAGRRRWPATRPGIVGDPGFDPQAITVGAADLTGHKDETSAPFSGYGETSTAYASPTSWASGVGLLSYFAAQLCDRADPPRMRCRTTVLSRGSGTRRVDCRPRRVRSPRC